jgi:hypothetical protein
MLIDQRWPFARSPVFIGSTWKYENKAAFSIITFSIFAYYQGGPGQSLKSISRRFKLVKLRLGSFRISELYRFLLPLGHILRWSDLTAIIG